MALTLGCAMRLSLLASMLLLAHAQQQRNIIYQEVPFNGYVTLNCNSVDGSPTFWRVPPRATQERRTSIAVVMDNSNKYGEYRCFSQPRGGPPRLGKTVKLIRPVTTVDLGNSLVMATIGQPFKIMCPVDFGPRNTNWYRFDKDRLRWVQPSRFIRTNSYALSRVTPADITTWQCESANGRPVNNKNSVSIVVSSGFVTSPKAKLTAPREMAADLFVVRDNRNKYVLECEPTGGRGGSQIAWEFKGNGQVANPAVNEGYVAVGRDASTANMQVQAADDFSLLEINKCQTQNTGYYRCKLPSGDRRYAKLMVKSPTPEIHNFGKRGQRKRVANVGEVINLHCALETPDASVNDLVWMFRPRGKENDPSAAVEFRYGDLPNNGVVVSIVGDRSRLAIQNAQKMNRGRYYCQYRGTSDFTDVVIGADFDVRLVASPSFNSISLSCVVYKNDVPESANYYRFTFFEEVNGQQKVLQNYRRLPRYSSSDRSYRCRAVNRATQKRAESDVKVLVGIRLTLKADTPTGLRVGAPLNLRCSSSDSTVTVSSMQLLLDQRRPPYSRRSEISPGVSSFNYERVTTRNTGTYTCVLGRGTIRSNAIKVVVCQTTERLCRDMSKCYPANRRCDGNRDCADGSDEDRNQCMDCEPHSLKCQTYNRRQPDTKCVLKHWICDGQDDCGNGWDEFVGNGYCQKHPLPIKNCGGCGRHESCCSDGRCFPRAYECDSETDCPADRIDETTCTCGETSQLEVDEPTSEVQKYVRAGTTVELTCLVRGKERPTINWRFNWGHLPDQVRFVETMTLDMVTPVGVQGAAEMYTVRGMLTIRNVNPKTDIGRYTCEAITKCKRRLVPDYILRLER